MKKKKCRKKRGWSGHEEEEKGEGEVKKFQNLKIVSGKVNI